MSLGYSQSEDETRAFKPTIRSAAVLASLKVRVVRKPRLLDGTPHMRKDSRLSRMLHVLLHMARHDGAFTSEQIGKMLGTNAVVVRRTLSGLRDAGFVSSEKGHRGGWRVVGYLGTVTLLDIYQSLGSPKVFAVGNDSDNPSCAVESVVNRALAGALDDAESLLMARLGQITLADLASDFDRLCLEEGWDNSHPY